jgi:hypothetical protein
MTIVLCLVVVAYAMVQSVFGVGLLVFGTPTLLLLGLPFEHLLAYLLPCSIAISALQVAGSGGVRLDPLRRQFLLYSAPLVLLGTVAILTIGSRLDIRFIVAVILVMTGVIRLSARAREIMGRAIRRFLPGCLLALGAIHGMSNLGGGVLTVIVSSVYEARTEIRRQIAFCYGMMALIQLATLVATGAAGVNLWLCLLLPVLAAATHALFGDRVFRAASRDAYQRTLSALIIAFGIALVVTSGRPANPPEAQAVPVLGKAHPAPLSGFEGIRGIERSGAA